MLKIVIFTFFFISLFAFDIDKEIEKILKLPPSQRYIYINKLKQKIMKLKESEREKEIKKLLSHYYINNIPPESIVKDK